MIRAAKTKGSYATMAIEGGCRGCHARGEWPGAEESTAHAMHACAGREVRRLIAWRGDVVKRLKYFLVQVRRIGEDARGVREQVQRALGAMCARHPTGDRYAALRNLVGGAVVRWGANEEAHDKEHNAHVVQTIMGIQSLFIERLHEWTARMAPHGWKRQERWKYRGWTQLILTSWRMHASRRVVGRYARRRALRQIGAILVVLYRDEESRRVGERRREARRRERAEARRKIRGVLWDIYIRREKRRQLAELPREDQWVGPVERWVDAVHEEGGDLAYRIKHAIRCMQMYVRVSLRPQRREREARVRKQEEKRRARWRICAMLVRIHKGEKQRGMLDERRRVRAGLVCANTRDVGRVTARGGVVYDETRRNAPRIQVHDKYKVKRWPRRDKCGPTLVVTLHYLWGIT